MHFQFATAVVLTLISATALAASEDSSHQTSTGSAWEQYDTNHDGAISKIEALKAVAQLFDIMDANRDGKLDQDELHSLHRSRHHSSTTPHPTQ